MGPVICLADLSRDMPGHPGVYLEMSGGGTRYESAGGLLHPATVSYEEVGGRSDLYTTSSLHYNISKRDIGDIQDNFSFSPINL